MKYIMVEVTHRRKEALEFKRRIPIIFPNALTHDLVFKAIAAMEEIVTLSPTVVGAGEITMTADSCNGHSVSLGIGAHPTDADIINTIDYTGGIV